MRQQMYQAYWNIWDMVYHNTRCRIQALTHNVVRAFPSFDFSILLTDTRINDNKIWYKRQNTPPKNTYGRR